MRWQLAATLGILGIVASGAERNTRHFLAVSATSYNPTAGEPPGRILLYDRDTLRPLGRLDYPGAASAPATTPDGTGLFVVLSGDQPGIAVVDLATLATRSFLPTPAGSFTLADDRILVLTGTGIAAIDPAATRVLKTVACPAPPQHLIYNGVNGAAFATMLGRQDLCVATPDLDPADPIPTPVGPHQIIDTAVLLDNNILLVTTYAGPVGPYVSYAVDLVNGRSAAAPALDAVYPSFVAHDDPTLLYGLAPDGARIYKVTFGPDGFPVFTPQVHAAPLPSFAGDPYIYTGVGGSCSTPEGPVTCIVGFRILDPSTLAVRNSLVLAQQTSFGLFGARSISPTLSAPYPLVNAFGSTASPPRRSRK